MPTDSKLDDVRVFPLIRSRRGGAADCGECREAAGPTAQASWVSNCRHERQIISIFVGQLLNRAKLQSEERYGWLPLVRDVDFWPLQDHFNAILKETADSIGVSNFIPPIDEFQDDDFVDIGHFSAKGAAKFALMITPIVKSSCK